MMAMPRLKKRQSWIPFSPCLILLVFFPTNAPCETSCDIDVIDAPTISLESADSGVRALSVTYSIGDVVINEFMADNETTVTDQDGDYDDWIELYNTTGSNICLSGYYLSDDSSEIIMWTFPDVSIPAGGFLIVWADKDDDREGLHADLKLSKDGEMIVLAAPDQTILDQVAFGGSPEVPST